MNLVLHSLKLQESLLVCDFLHRKFVFSTYLCILLYFVGLGIEHRALNPCKSPTTELHLQPPILFIFVLLGFAFGRQRLYHLTHVPLLPGLLVFCSSLILFKS